MILAGFLLASTGLCLALGFLVQFRSYRKALRILLLVLSGLFTAHIWLAHAAVFSDSLERWYQLHRVLIGLALAEGLALLALTRHFLRPAGGSDERVPGGLRVPANYMAAAAGAAAVLLAVPGVVAVGGEVGMPVLLFTGFGTFVPGVMVVMSLYTLYLLENTYRLAQDYQRRIGRLCFIGIATLVIFHILYYSRVLLYNSLPTHYAEASSIVSGVVFPVVLAGFLRYRLGSEQISIPRDTVYASATVFLAGAAFLGVALSAAVFRWFELDFSYFERFLLVFTVCFLTILVIVSGTMRKRISRIVNEQLYSHKYDYQEQFFRLHKSMLSVSGVETTLTELVENMKYSVTVDDATIFIFNWQDGNFYQHQNKEASGRQGLVIGGDSPLVRMLAERRKPLDLLGKSPEDAEARDELRRDALLAGLGCDAAFPIFIHEGAQGERLVGLLALQGGRTRPFDGEDLELIGVFTASIGNALFRNRALMERVEQKQFESFHHVASFIIHDIKNQVATLSLILKNAEHNIGNPSFQASMLSSVKSCATNLQGLIDRLAVAPRRQQLSTGVHPLRPLLEEAMANSGLLAPPAGLEVVSECAEAEAEMDRQAVFFVVRNLVNNALEAMQAAGEHGPRGRLTLRCGPLGSAGAEAVPGLRSRFGRSDGYFAAFAAYILVGDTGAGMDREFLQRRLFQPFATTKEKGVGIGLYQCKTMVEKMGGSILCRSEPGAGTEFGILLPGPKDA